MADEIFEHTCVDDGCIEIVTYDDAPWCIKHAPENGIHLPGYSARRAYNLKMHLESQADAIDKERGKRNNIFEQEKE